MYTQCHHSAEILNVKPGNT